MRKRNAIILLILLLAIGFAAVSTTLIINGTIMFGTNEEEFIVIFTKAIVDDVDLSDTALSDDGKTITYETKELAFIDEESILDFTVRNNSTQYDAEININCIGGANEGTYYELEYDLPTFVAAQSEIDGYVTARMIRSSVNEIIEELTCTLNVTAMERNTLIGGTTTGGESSTYSLYGYLVDENNNPLPNTAIVAYSNPVYGVTDENGYIYLGGLETGNHELYIMGEKTIEELQSLSREEIETNAVTNIGITTNTVDIVFPNGNKIVDSVIEKTKIFNITLDADGGELEETSKEVTKGLTYGELPTPTRDGYTFEGWYNEEDEKIEETTRVEKGEEHTLTAKWTANTYTVAYNANGGTGTMSSVTHTYGVAKNLTVNTFTRSMYNFNGWNTVADGSGTSYANGASVTNLTATNGGTVTLYAQWEKLVTVTSGTGSSAGDIISIGTEQFYVISNDGTNIKMLARYNLYVGGEYISGSGYTAYTNPTGIQDSTMRGYVPGQTARKGGTAFGSSSTYSGSTVAGYVSTYSNYLKNTYGVTNTATLISKEEIETIVGSTLSDSSSYNISNLGAPSWLYSTAYWTRTAKRTDSVWYVASHGIFSFTYYTYSYDFGVRPVITISASLI